MSHPAVFDPDLVGTYPATAKSGGGYVWDEVLEYRVWCHPERGAPDEADGSDYYYPFASYEGPPSSPQEQKAQINQLPLSCNGSSSTNPSLGDMSMSEKSASPNGRLNSSPDPSETKQPSPTSLHRMRRVIGSTSFEALRRNRRV